MNYRAKIGDLLIRRKKDSHINHVGVIVGYNAVAQNTPERGEHIVNPHDFAAGQPVAVIPTNADPDAVQTRARKVFSRPRRYHAFFRNCEHTANEIAHGVARSPQLVIFVVLGLILVGAVILLSRRSVA